MCFARLVTWLTTFPKSRYIHTPIIGDPMDSLIHGSGVTYAAVEDAAACLLKIASDQKINGQYRANVERLVLTDAGRAFAIVPVGAQY